MIIGERKPFLVSLGFIAKATGAPANFCDVTSGREFHPDANLRRALLAGISHVISEADRRPSM
ncbi:MAG: hypothetical protein ABJF50_18510, partial [Paracoccaceae bacterium]